MEEDFLRIEGDLASFLIVLDVCPRDGASATYCFLNVLITKDADRSYLL